jgi:hypothetical protein
MGQIIYRSQIYDKKFIYKEFLSTSTEKCAELNFALTVATANPSLPRGRYKKKYFNENNSNYHK